MEERGYVTDAAVVAALYLGGEVAVVAAQLGDRSRDLAHRTLAGDVLREVVAEDADLGRAEVGSQVDARFRGLDLAPQLGRVGDVVAVARGDPGEGDAGGAAVFRRLP